MAKKRTPAVEGWFTLDAERPALLGTRCRACGTVFFPREETFCRNPACAGTAFEEVRAVAARPALVVHQQRLPAAGALRRAADPFEPYAVAAVELERERMVVLGQVVDGVAVADLEVGMEMELVLDTL